MTCCPRPAMKDSLLVNIMPCVSLLDPSPHWGHADVEVCMYDYDDEHTYYSIFTMKVSDTCICMCSFFFFLRVHLCQL